MQQIHAYFADSFGSMELGTRSEQRAIDPIAYNYTKVNIAAAPGAAAPAANADVNAATDRDREVNAAILADLKKRQAGAVEGAELHQLVNAVTASGNPTGAGMQQVWNKANEGVDGAVALRNEVYNQLQVDIGNMGGSAGTQFDNTQLGTLFANMANNDGTSQAAAEEVLRRYSAGLEVRGDLALAITLEDAKLAQAVKDGNGDAKTQAEGALEALRKQQANVDANLTAMDQQLKATGHGGALNGYRLGTAFDGTINSADEATRVAENAHASNENVLKYGLGQDDKGVFTTIPEGGNLTETVRQLTADGKTDDPQLMKTLIDLNKITNADQVNAGQKIYLPKEVVDKLANTYNPGDSELKLALGQEIDWLNRWMPLTPNSGYEPTGDPEALWAQYGPDNADAGANLGTTLGAVKGDADKLEHFRNFITKLYEAHGSEAPDMSDSVIADLEAPAGTDAAQPGAASTTGGLDPNGEGYKRLNGAVESLVNEKDGLYIGPADATGKRNYVDENDNGHVTNLAVKFVQDHARRAEDIPAAIDQLVSTIDFETGNVTDPEGVKNRFRREMYAAYGLEEPSGSAAAPAVAKQEPKDRARLDSALTRIIDKDGDLFIGDADASGNRNYVESNKDGAITNQVVDYISARVRKPEDLQPAIDQLIASVGFGDGAGDNQSLLDQYKAELKRDLYAAYGLKAG